MLHNLGLRVGMDLDEKEVCAGVEEAEMWNYETDMEPKVRNAALRALVKGEKPAKRVNLRRW